MNRHRHALTVVALLALSCLVQFVVVRRATVTGLDAVRFVRIAQEIDREGILATVRYERQQPLFPVWVWAVHRGWVAVAGESPSAWATSVQLAAAIPLVLAIVPVFFAMLRLAGFRAALAGGIFFCLLPEVSRLGADGISDSTHLLFFCLAFWAMVEWFRGQESGFRGQGERVQGSGFRVQGLGAGGWLVVAGVATAMGVLARAEVLVLAVAFGVTLSVSWFSTGRRRAWRRPAAAGACFVLGLAVVLLPYLAVVGPWTPRAAAGRILGRYEQPRESSPPAATGNAGDWRLDDGEQASFTTKEPGISLRRRGYPAALIQFGRKLADAYGYWAGVLALWGAWRLCRRKATAADRFVQIFFVLFCVAAIRFAAVEGYLAPRHLLVLVVAGIGAAGFGALELGDRIAGWVARWGRTSNVPVTAAAWSVVLLVSLACLPQTLVRHHDSRMGHRAAGQWLAAQVPAAGKVVDTLGWTGLYSGRVTCPYEEAAALLSDPDLAYVVLEAREMEYDSRRSRTLRWLVRAAAEPAAEFPHPAARKPNQQPVMVLRWYPDRFRRQAICGPAGPTAREDQHALAGPKVRR